MRESWRVTQLLITGARLFDPASNLDVVADLFIAEGKILAIGKPPQNFKPDLKIDANGLLLIPGLVDLCARLREPGKEKKGNIVSETTAAARGGITTVLCPPDTDPPIDTPAVAELIRRRAKMSAHSRVLSLGAMTVGLKGERLTEMAALITGGCIGVSNAREPFADLLVLRRAMEYAATWNIPVFLQPQDPHLANHGVAHEGLIASRLGLPGIPTVAETVAVAASLELARLTGVHLHLQQISTARSVAMIQSAQQQGVRVSADVAAHQLYLTETDIEDFNANCHLLPPLRTPEDREALRKGITEGVIGAVCSAHEPHEPDAKMAPFPSTEPGLSGLETLLPLLLHLADEGVINLSRAIELVTSGPARIARLPLGQLREGFDADCCLIDTQRNWRFDTAIMLSQGRNSPFSGWRFRGDVRYTLFEGRITYQSDL